MEEEIDKTSTLNTTDRSSILQVSGASGRNDDSSDSSDYETPLKKMRPSAALVSTVRKKTSDVWNHFKMTESCSIPTAIWYSKQHF